MHEMALCEGVLQLIEENAAAGGFSRVLGVRLDIGELAGVDTEALRFSFDAVTRDTIAADAALDISAVPGQAWCEACQSDVHIAHRIEPCPRCGGLALRVTGGTDMLLRSLEVA